MGWGSLRFLKRYFSQSNGVLHSKLNLLYKDFAEKYVLDTYLHSEA